MAQFTLTEDEFRRLGGTTPPDDYVPDELRAMPWTGTGPKLYATRGVVPAIQHDSLLVWQDVAARLGLRVFSIRWPDPYYPDFVAELL